MDRDIGKVEKNPETQIIVRIDDYGGKRGVTIREFVKSERYTGFTKAGTRIPAEKFKEFKEIINSIEESDLVTETQQNFSEQKKIDSKKPAKKEEDIEEEVF